jgi:hypothetical protein
MLSNVHVNVYDRVRSETFRDVRRRSKKEDVNERYSIIL